MYQWDVFAVSGSFATSDLRHRWLGYVCATTRAEADHIVARRRLADGLEAGERLRVRLVGLYVTRPGRIT